NGRLADAVRHAAQASDWSLAAGMVIDGLAIGEIIEPRRGRSLADEFAAMPYGEAWAGPAPYLVSAAIALSAGPPGAATAALDAAEKPFAQLPAGHEDAGHEDAGHEDAGHEDAARLAAAMIRLAASRRTGDLTAAAQAAARVEALLSKIPGGGPARHP